MEREGRGDVTKECELARRKNRGRERQRARVRERGEEWSIEYNRDLRPLDT